MPLSDKLKDIRVRNGLTMEELVDRLNKKYGVNISKSMISRWENGHSEPVNSFLAIYAKEFGVDLNFLLGLDVERAYYHDPDIVNRLQESLEDPRKRYIMDSTRKLSNKGIDAVEDFIRYQLEKEGQLDD